MRSLPILERHNLATLIMADLPIQAKANRQIQEYSFLEKIGQPIFSRREFFCRPLLSA